jgi:outer membrane lipoprotein-sorting protein
MVSAALAALPGSGCGGAARSRQQVRAGAAPPAKEASAEELIASYNRIARGWQSLVATVELKPTAGSAYSGVIEEYHEVRGFILAERPAMIRVIGQAPVVGKNIFDMVSDAQTFRIYIPSKHEFIVGPARLERATKKPIENLRPQHLLDALFWPIIGPQQTVLFEEFNDETGRYYILTELKSGQPPEIARRIWCNRADLQVARLEIFGSSGKLLADIVYRDWEATPQTGTGRPPSEAKEVIPFPREIVLTRPRDDYSLDLRVTKLQLNSTIDAERFQLEQPSGTDLVKLGEEGEGAGR